jgi:hypothetical protein
MIKNHLSHTTIIEFVFMKEEIPTAITISAKNKCQENVPKLNVKLLQYNKMDPITFRSSRNGSRFKMWTIEKLLSYGICHKPRGWIIHFFKAGVN